MRRVGKWFRKQSDPLRGSDHGAFPHRTTPGGNNRRGPGSARSPPRARSLRSPLHGPRSRTDEPKVVISALSFLCWRLSDPLIFLLLQPKLLSVIVGKGDKKGDDGRDNDKEREEGELDRGRDRDRERERPRGDDRRRGELQRYRPGSARDRERGGRRPDDVRASERGRGQMSITIEGDKPRNNERRGEKRPREEEPEETGEGLEERKEKMTKTFGITRVSVLLL